MFLLILLRISLKGSYTLFMKIHFKKNIFSRWIFHLSAKWESGSFLSSHWVILLAPVFPEVRLLCVFVTWSCEVTSLGCPCSKKLRVLPGQKWWADNWATAIILQKNPPAMHWQLYKDKQIGLLYSFHYLFYALEHRKEKIVLHNIFRTSWLKLIRVK